MKQQQVSLFMFCGNREGCGLRFGEIDTVVQNMA
ncbi:hypothetical protein COLO4_36903 [Corchorus olitorius]|uniref:Uncharacterized protein n=1 Tax=Corchorus olitorius TaxID=93759 RepID=A0A1R3G4H0_9ROSI|nr:hypothetical protein COLO4_36903 [Corchorus olitorius]